MRSFIGIFVWFVSLPAAHICLAQNTAPDLLFDGGRDALVSTIEAVHVKVADGVSGNCFPRPSAVKTAVELVFRRSGFAIEAEEGINPTVEVQTIGVRNQTVAGRDIGCTGHIDVVLWIWAVTSIPHTGGETIAPNIMYGRGALMSGMGDLQDRFRQSAVEQAELIANDLLRARSETFKKFPFLNEEFKKAKAKQ